MGNDWRNHWRKSRWVTIADFPLLTLDINPATYEGGQPDAGHRGNELLKQAFAEDEERVGIKLRMLIHPGYPQHKARHLVRMSCRPGEYRPDRMDREVLMRDAIAFAVDEGWEVPGWLRSLIVDTPSSVVNPTTLNQSAGEQGAQEYTGEQGDPATSPPSKKRPGRPKIDTAGKLLTILEALEHFAARNKEPFDRQAMPGPLGGNWQEEGSFHWLCAKIYPTFKRAKSTFEKHRSGICAISVYAKETNFYLRALPVIAPKIGGASDVRTVQRRSKKVY